MNLSTIKGCIARFTGTTRSVATVLADLEAKKGELSQVMERATAEAKAAEEVAAQALSKAVGLRSEALKAERVRSRLETFLQ
jgi:outer membrane murein-binding lipoprotein Lpp